jgi:tetratricopeptide (TPR) repeat protein
MSDHSESICFRFSDRVETKYRISFLTWRLFIAAIIMAIPFIQLPAGLGAPEDYDSIFDEANQYLKRDNYEESLRLFTKANAMKNNASQECLWRIAQIFSKMGAHKNALQTCDQLIQISKDNLFYQSKALDMIGTTLISYATADPERPDEMKLVQAEAVFLNLLKINPEMNMAHYNRGMALAWLGRFNEAIGEFQVFAKSAEDDETARRARRFIENPRLARENLAPDFACLSADGSYTTSDELRGKVILLSFWSARNSLSTEAIPFISKLANKFKNDPFMLIGVNAYDPESKWRDYISQNKMNWLQTSDKNGKLVQSFQIKNVPTYILIDHEGIIRFRTMGTSPQIEDQIKHALKWADDMKNRPKPKYEALAPPVLDSTTKVVPGTKTASIATEKNSFRIPKPVIQVSNMEVAVPAGARVRNNIYRLQITNWASMPDELFTSSKDLPPCRSSITYISSGSSPSNSRIEIFILNERAERLQSYCGLPRAENIQSFSFSVPEYIKTGKIYIRINDRLTGNSAESEMVAVP